MDLELLDIFGKNANTVSVASYGRLEGSRLTEEP